VLKKKTGSFFLPHGVLYCTAGLKIAEHPSTVVAHLCADKDAESEPESEQREQASPPVLLKSPRDQVVAEGSDVLFQCHVTGRPQPLVVWKKRDGQIPAERSVSLSLSPPALSGSPFASVQ